MHVHTVTGRTMQVKEASPVLMTNTEVLEMLYRRSERRKATHNEISPSAMGPSLEHLEWIEEHVRPLIVFILFSIVFFFI